MICAIIVKSINFGRLYQSYRIKIFLEGMKLTLKSMWFFYIANQNQLDSLFITSILRATLHRFPLFIFIVHTRVQIPPKENSLHQPLLSMTTSTKNNWYFSFKNHLYLFQEYRVSLALTQGVHFPSRQRQGCIIWETTRRWNMTT